MNPALSIQKDDDADAEAAVDEAAIIVESEGVELEKEDVEEL